MNLSPAATTILANLRSNYESSSAHADGSEWGSVYLDNAKPNEMSAHVFAGHLSALKESGVYRQTGSNGAFGDVLLAPVAIVPAVDARVLENRELVARISAADTNKAKWSILKTAMKARNARK